MNDSKKWMRAFNALKPTGKTWLVALAWRTIRIQAYLDRRTIQYPSVMR